MPPPESGIHEWTLDEIAGMALQRIGDRLADTDADIPDHVLAKYLAMIEGYERRREEREQREQSLRANKSVLDIIRDSDLPLEKKRAVVRTEIDRLHQEITELEAELDE